ncbi:MAG: GNAT family N-acetyltransferase [Paludibacteraceae bacterium]|nr:GNAT family N-acetyltransferase [Paludibacteraceae bacterium]
MTNKERYAQWAAEVGNVPLMMQPWWMDAVCAGKQWDVLLVEDDKGEILGAMPYLLRKRIGQKYIVMPQQTTFGGIWVAPSITDNRWEIAQVCQSIDKQLRALKLSYYYQQYPIGSLPAEAMRGMRFRIREHIAYRIDFLADIDQIIASFSKNKRRQLQKAASLTSDRQLNVEDFYKFHAHCQEEQHKKISYTREFLLVLERKARRLEQCDILAVRNLEGEVYAAAFLVWDRTTMYFFIPCADPAYKDSGAFTLLVLEAIKLAHQKKLAFDFSGLADTNTLRQYSQFGTTPAKFYSAERSYRPLSAFFIRCAEHFT